MENTHECFTSVCERMLPDKEANAPNSGIIDGGGLGFGLCERVCVKEEVPSLHIYVEYRIAYGVKYFMYPVG